ncbi:MULTISPECIES: hypothetical protein [Alcaligenaceae]|uniref:hypothetical protein n=1 Tax=Alcaligenaceae TaxID=506 RepID=UPI0018D0D2A5|nr:MULTISPECIES: hypothetical protein [Alcaligenaceae]MBH0312200.1 hypothetical protein [Alcaligenes faecalis]MDF3846663.1 hypothetical protein [Achromobacter denitrificans]
MIERLRETLSRVQKLAGDEFSGIGVIVHDREACLPVFPLRLHSPSLINADVEKSLASIASNKSEFHDGFHLLSLDWKLTAVAQYFSPPILQNAEIQWERKFGGRYLAAQFGSALPGVTISGIVTSSCGLAIFMAGREVHYENL